MASDVKWIKITTDIFDDEKVLLIESLPDAYAIITVWFKLLCLAGKQNNSGVFMMGRIPYTDKMLATIFRMKESSVTMALQTFEQFGMVEIVDGVITIPNWNKHQSLDRIELAREQTRQRVARHREKQKQLVECNAQCNADVTQCNADRIEEEKEEEKEVDIESKKEKTDLQSVVDLYHNICKSYPSVRSLSDARKKAIRARLKSYSLEDFKTVFENAENSSFLKGSNDRNWSANFDWLIADKNMAKVLEGNYADKPRYGRKEPVPGWAQPSLGSAELEAIQRVLREDPDTAGNNPEIAEKAERLRERLGG